MLLVDKDVTMVGTAGVSRMLRIGGLSLLLLLAGATLAGAAVAAASPGASAGPAAPPVSGAAPAGSVGPAAGSAGVAALGSPAAARPGSYHASGRQCGSQCWLVTATGFEPGQRVTVAELDRPGWQTDRRADATGNVRIGLRLPRGRGEVVTFVGEQRPVPTPATGTIIVTIPRHAVFRLSVSGR